MNRFLLTSITWKVFKPFYLPLNKINSLNIIKFNDLLLKRHLLAIDRRYSSLDSSEINATKEVIKDNEIDYQKDSKVSESQRQLPIESIGESIEISDGCVERLKKVIDNKEEMLRVEVNSGGCSGLSYKFDICNTSGPEDRIFEKNGVKVVIDSESLKFIKGSTIDYSEELIKSSFRVIDNPQSVQGCSCGASFALKLDDGFKFKT